MDIVSFENADSKLDLIITSIIDKPNIYVAEIFNINGHSIIKLFNEMIEPGFHSFTWGGKNKYGNGVPSGTYFLVVSNGQISNKQKILLLK